MTPRRTWTLRKQWAEILATVYEHHEVACETCGAPPWHPCVTRTSGLWTATHKARLRHASPEYEGRVERLVAGHMSTEHYGRLCRPSSIHHTAQLALVRQVVDEAPPVR